jgi:hypothetical protein
MQLLAFDVLNDSTAMYKDLNLTPWWDSNTASFVLEPDAMTTLPRQWETAERVCFWIPGDDQMPSRFKER